MLLAYAQSWTGNFHQEDFFEFCVKSNILGGKFEFGLDAWIALAVPGSYLTAPGSCCRAQAPWLLRPMVCRAPGLTWRPCSQAPKFLPLYLAVCRGSRNLWVSWEIFISINTKYESDCSLFYLLFSKSSSYQDLKKGIYLISLPLFLKIKFKGLIFQEFSQFHFISHSS